MSGFAAGAFDRRITIEHRTVVKDPVYGTNVSKWVPLIKVWAQVRDVLPSRAENIDQNVSLQRRPARVRIRYRDGITADMRIIYQGRTLEIVSGPVELGRKEALEMMVQELSTQGEAP